MALELDIEGIGKVRIPREASWATEDTQLRIEKLLGGTRDPVKDAIDADGKKPGSFGSGLKKSAKEFLKSSDAQKEFAYRIQSAGSGTVDFTKNLLQGERGFASLNPIIGTISGAFADLVSTIPVVGGALGGAIGTISKVRQELNVFLDGFLDKFDTLAQSGLQGSKSLIDLQIAARDGRISLDTLIGATTQASAGLIALEGNFTRGVEKFIKTQTALAAMEGNMLEKLGLNVDDQAAFISEFIQNNRNNAMLNNMSQAELNKTVFDTAKNMRILAEFTGTDIQAQREAAIANAADMAFQARLLEMSNAGREEEVDRIRAFVDSIASQDPSGVITQRFKEEFSTFGGVVSEQSGVLDAILSKSGVNVSSLADQVQNGTIGVTDAVAEILSSAQQALSTDTTFAAQLSMIDGGANTLSTVAQGLIQALGRFTDGDVKTAAAEAKNNVENINTELSDFSKGLVEGRESIQDALATLEQTLLQSSDRLIAMSLQSNIAMADGLKNIIEGAQLGDVALIAQGMVTVFGEGIIPGLGEKLGDKIGGLGGLGEKIKNDALRNKMMDMGMGAFDEFAEGGTMPANSVGIVGEEGPELIGTDRIAQILSNPDTKKIVEEFGGMAGYIADPFVEETKSYHPATSIVYSNQINMSDDLLNKLGGMDINTVIQAYEAMNNAGAGSRKGANSQDLRDQQIDLTKEIDNIHFGDDDMKHEVKGLRKDLKNMMGKVLSGNGYF